ncbi:MAG: sugar lactone lactonase YvrE, partial [Ilumatobacter sp.]
GNVYVADTGNQLIRKITSAGVVTTLAGTAGATGSADGTGAAARFDSPSGVAVDGSGNVYVADTGNQLIRKITSAGVVTTLAGTAGATGSADGTGAAASFDFPFGVAVDGSGNVYVADAINHLIRKIN